MLFRAQRAPQTPGESTILKARLVHIVSLTLFALSLTCGAQAADEKKKDESAKKEKKTRATVSASASSKAKKRERTTSQQGLRPGEAASWMFFVNGGIRSDSGRSKAVDAIGDSEEEPESLNRDIKALGPLFHMGAIKKIGRSVGIGAAFGYGVNYNMRERLTKEQRQNDEEPDRWQMGQLLSLDVRFEWSGHVTDKVAIAITPLAGITTIVSGGSLQEQTDTWKGSHAIGPRLGFVVGGDLGLRYYVSRWFSFKGGVGFNYFVQQMLHAKRRGEIVNSKHTWSVSASRLNASLALEASF